MAHPGKKLLFMGSEFGQFIEWKDDDQLDWFLMVYERHPDLCRCVRMLNHSTGESPMYEVDDSWEGFKWLVPDDKERSLVVFMRMDKEGNTVICMTNFTSAFYPQYRFGLPDPGILTEVFNTDLKEFGVGSDQFNAHPLHTVEEECNQLPYMVEVCVPPLSTVYFTFDKEEPALKSSRRRRPLWIAWTYSKKRRTERCSRKTCIAMLLAGYQGSRLGVLTCAMLPSLPCPLAASTASLTFPSNCVNFRD